MNYFGLGSKLIRKVMKNNDVTSHEELIALAQEFDMYLVACVFTCYCSWVRRGLACHIRLNPRRDHHFRVELYHRIGSCYLNLFQNKSGSQTTYVRRPGQCA